MTWLLAYLLIGFVLSWVSAIVFKMPPNDWKWELLAILMWPMTVLMGLTNND